MEILEMNRTSPANSIQPPEAGYKENTGLHTLCRVLAKPLPEAGTDSRFIQTLSGRNSIMTPAIYPSLISAGIAKNISPLDRLAGERNAKKNPTQNTEK